jgi:hypothetical protein
MSLKGTLQKIMSTDCMLIAALYFTQTVSAHQEFASFAFTPHTQELMSFQRTNHANVVANIALKSDLVFK